MHPHVWLPAFQPIEGHYWLLKHVLAGHDAATAEGDAPWRRYTSLQLDIARTYGRARVDWWGLLWMRSHPHLWLAGLGLMLLMGTALVGGACLWTRACLSERRDARRRPRHN